MQKHKANISTSQMITEAYQSEFGPDKNIQLIYNGFSETQQTEYPHLEKIRLIFYLPVDSSNKRNFDFNKCY